MTKQFSRRDFLILSAQGIGAAVVSYGLMGCSDSDSSNRITATFNHGIASGDPLADAVILWTRVTPESDGEIEVSWEVATDQDFTDVITNGSTTTTAARDYTVKVDAIGLAAGTIYYYRFHTGDNSSVTGRTKTLPEGNVDSVKLAVFSCSNYPAGYFNVYHMASLQNDIDAALHLGDYIYEYGPNKYAYENAEALGREVLPAKDLIELADYRTRYGQYRSDANLQAFHAKVPFITVWDDHEVANDTWRDGAENHKDTDGDFDLRKAGALQAYFEWLPIRPWNEGNNESIYRSFAFGDLVDLHMLDTRVIARDKQLDYADYLNPATGSIDEAGFTAAVSDPNRTMLGAEQLSWLQSQLTVANGRWQVLGQQVLMGTMRLPAAILLPTLGLPGLTITEYGELGAIAQLAGRAAANDPSLTTEELAFLQANQDRLTPDVQALLTLPSIPYNLDAWDGYAYEREVLLQTVKALGKNLVVLAGDTHNAWANELKDLAGDIVGVEFAGTSVSSPGMEQYLGIRPEERDAVEAGVVGLVEDLKYANLTDRGFLTVTFTQDQARAQWHFVDTILSQTYAESTDRYASAHSMAGTPGVVLG